MAVGEGKKISLWTPGSFTKKQNKVKKEKKLFEFEASSNSRIHKETHPKDVLRADHYHRLEGSQRLHSPVEKPPRIHRKASNTSASDTRLSKKKNDSLDYDYVVVEETELEKATRERLTREVKQQNWIENESVDISLNERPLSSPQQNYAPTHVGDDRFKNRSAVSFRGGTHYCYRGIHTDKGEFSKQFCDVLGPTLCTDCTKSQMQQCDVDEHVRAFPNICVSPYTLCVPHESERDVLSKTPMTVYRECNPLQRRRNSIASPVYMKGSKTRPNSCNDERSAQATHCTVSSRTSSPLFDTPGLVFGVDTPSYSSRCSSRRSSISRYRDSRNEELRELEDNEERRVDPINSTLDVHFSRGSKGNAQNRLDPNCFGTRNASLRSPSRVAALKSRSALCKTPSGIERTGKLSELPYWKFLIPEPPKMEVGRMNVSMYTPKEIPGIKIFDETFFDI